MGWGMSGGAGISLAAGKAGVLRCLAVLVLCSLVSGCAAYTDRIKAEMAANLAGAIADSNDPKTVADAVPAYLLMTDGFLRGAPENEPLLISASRLYGTYATVFVSDKERAKALTERALGYARRALCVRSAGFCDLDQSDFRAFSTLLAETEKGDLAALFAVGAAWGGWIEARKDDLSALAKISRIEAVMNRVLALDEGFEDGGAHLYLGVMATLLPPALGGRPEAGRKHFERALELSGGKNLMMKVLYAEKYARMMFDRPLHDRLLGEVMAADAGAPGYRLVNLLAKERASVLLSEADDYF